MNNFSVTIVGILVMFLSNIMDSLDLPIVQDDLVATVNTLILLVGGLVAWYGRWRKGDITWYGKRK